MRHPQKIREPPGKQGQGHDDPMPGQGDALPKCQEITHTDRNTRKRQRRRDHKVKCIFARNTGARDQR